MTARPILMSGPMVRALLDGKKTQTRRIVKPQPGQAVRVAYRRPDGDFTWCLETGHGVSDAIRCPYGYVGHSLWVRETFYPAFKRTEHNSGCVFKADDNGRDLNPGWSPNGDGTGWKPSIHMPRWASRICLNITDVRAERLQSISAADSWAEGIPHSPDVNPVHEYQELWEKINGKGSWDTNPWVWVIGFEMNRC